MVLLNESRRLELFGLFHYALCFFDQPKLLHGHVVVVVSESVLGPVQLHDYALGNGLL